MKSQCAICGQKLNGTNKRTKSRPTRKFAGVLCATCTEKAMKVKARVEAGSKEKISLKYKKYIQPE